MNGTDAGGEPTADVQPAGGGAPARPRSPVPAIVAVVAVVVAALVALFATSGGDGETDTSEQVVADAAPPLVGTTTSGDTFDLADEEGRWALVNFFATWCPPCVAEHPELVEFSRRNAETATVVSVAFDEPAPVIEEFFEANGGDWPVVADAGGIPIDWGVVKLPESFLVSPEGQVVAKLEGGVTAQGIEDLIAGSSTGPEG